MKVAILILVPVTADLCWFKQEIIVYKIKIRWKLHGLTNNGYWLVAYWAVQWSWFARVNALCNLSRKKSREVAASLPGRFLSRRCFTLCITMEVEPIIAKQYKCHHCCSCKNYRGKEMEGGKEESLRRFWLTRRSRVRGKNVLKVGSVKFANSLSPPTIVKKVRTGSKSSQGT